MGTFCLAAFSQQHFFIFKYNTGTHTIAQVLSLLVFILALEEMVMCTGCNSLLE